MVGYTIYERKGCCWVWAGTGTTEAGCSADLPDEVYMVAEDEPHSGDSETVEADGGTYRIDWE